MYTVKELFYTLQGEGVNAGRPAVFCRFAGCNLWSGREADRATAVCQINCDTDFVGGQKFEFPGVLAVSLRQLWTGGARPFVVLTGGEPMLQVDRALLHELHAVGFEVALETNGTVPVPDLVDWITVSPKAGTTVIQRQGHELKVVVPQPLDLEPLLRWRFRHYLLQPMDGPDREANTQLAAKYCLAHPPWRLSLQTHKIVGLP